MYEEYFGLKTKPFSIVPDPHYFYMSDGHSEALAHLLYGIKNEGGFVLLTGEVGTGKTTVCRRLLELMPEECNVAFILNPKVSVEELLATVCDEFGITYPEGTSSIKVFVTCINHYLLEEHEKGRRAVLIIEEAQNLDPEVLEQIRLLTNLETNKHKLLQIIMLGQPELREMLLQPQLSQLSQRVTARYHLGPLSLEETSRYVNYRLSVAGLVRGQLFSPPVIKRLFRLTGGVPRLINVICDRALLGAFVEGKDGVDIKTLTTAAREVVGSTPHRRPAIATHMGMVAGLLLALAAVLGLSYYAYRETYRPVAPTVRPPALAATAAEPKGSLQPPGDLQTEDTAKAAYAALFGAWRIPFSKGDEKSVCHQAETKGLACVKGRGSISDLIEMNRPAVLQLRDPSSRIYYAALTGLQGDRATFVLGNETRTVEVKELADRWSGGFLLLWKAPEGYRERVKPGTRGPMVAWLERQLALTDGQAAPAEVKQVYDQDLERRVRRFQVSTGLMPDGIAGQRTILRLASGVVDGQPSLHGGKEGR